MRRGLLKTYIKASKFNSLYIFFTVFTGVFGYLYLNKFLIGNIGKVVVDSMEAEAVDKAAAQVEAAAQPGVMIGGGAGGGGAAEVLPGGGRSGRSTLGIDMSAEIGGG